MAYQHGLAMGLGTILLTATFMVQENIHSSDENWDAAFKKSWTISDLVDCIYSYAMGRIVTMLTTEGAWRLFFWPPLIPLHFACCTQSKCWSVRVCVLFMLSWPTCL